MAADKKPIIVIKKITIAAAAAHGGSWKVAFADFMTAMMAFFLVMWLVGQSEEVKKSVSDYFSTPSIIEYNFSNYGVELTLEKLFMDIMNEPLKAFESFVTPTDRLPNIMDMGTKKIQLHFVTEQLGKVATNVDINPDEITFDIPDDVLFQRGNAKAAAQFVSVMEKVRTITEGAKDADIFVNVELPTTKSMPKDKARSVAEERLDILIAKIEAGLRGQNVDIYGKTTVENISPVERRKNDTGMIKFRIKQKDNPEEGKKGAKSSSSKKAVKPEASNENAPPTVEARAPQSEKATEDRDPADDLSAFADQMAEPLKPNKK